MVIRSLFHSEICCDPATSSSSFSSSSSSSAASASGMTMMMMRSSSPTPPAPLETISLHRTTASSPTASSSRPLTPRSALAATYATYVVRVHTRHGIKTISFDLLAGFFTYTAKKAAEDLGISSRTLIRVCRSLGIRRWPYLGFRSEKNVERIRQEAIENLRRKLEREGAETAPSAMSATHSTTSCLRGASAKRLLQVKVPQMTTAAVAPMSTYHSASHHHHPQQQPPQPQRQQQQNHCINTIVSPSAAVHHDTQHQHMSATFHNHLAQYQSQNQSQSHRYSYNQVHNQIQMPLLTPPHAHHAFNLETEPTLSPRRVHNLHNQHPHYQHHHHEPSSAASSPSSSSTSSSSPSPASSSMPSLNVLMEASILTAFKHEMTRPAESPRAAEPTFSSSSSSSTVDSADAQHHARTMSMRDILSHTAMAA